MVDYRKPASRVVRLSCMKTRVEHFSNAHIDSNLTMALFYPTSVSNKLPAYSYRLNRQFLTLFSLTSQSELHGISPIPEWRYICVCMCWEASMDSTSRSHKAETDNKFGIEWFSKTFPAPFQVIKFTFPSSLAELFSLKNLIWYLSLFQNFTVFSIL